MNTEQTMNEERKEELWISLRSYGDKYFQWILPVNWFLHLMVMCTWASNLALSPNITWEWVSVITGYKKGTWEVLRAREIISLLSWCPPIWNQSWTYYECGRGPGDGMRSYFAWRSQSMAVGPRAFEIGLQAKIESSSGHEEEKMGLGVIAMTETGFGLSYIFIELWEIWHDRHIPEIPARVQWETLPHLRDLKPA